MNNEAKDDDDCVFDEDVFLPCCDVDFKLINIYNKTR